MKKKLFCDQSKSLYIKIASSDVAARREILGGKILANFAQVPEMELLDGKTILINKVEGIKSTKVENGKLNDLLFDYFCCLKGVGAEPAGNSIFEEIERLFILFGDSQTFGLLRKRLAIAPLFPVHGDLQKQNIFVNKSGLSFIDFEHFLFAPRELELANSLFFSDSNCLDLAGLLPKMVNHELIKHAMLGDMLVYYTLRQVASGRSLTESERRYQAGLAKLKGILGQEVNSSLPLQLRAPAFLCSWSCRE